MSTFFILLIRQCFELDLNMQSEQQKPILSIFQKSLIGFIVFLIVISLVIFRNLFFQPTLILKSFGESSINPEIAFNNNKPTFLEFYAEWCEVCKEMAPKVSLLKDEYENQINFVFLNVDNSKWESYIRKFNVNGIPQVNVFNKEGNLEATFIGKQEEKKIKESLHNVIKGIESNEEITNSDLSIIKKSKNYQVSPRSHA